MIYLNENCLLFINWDKVCALQKSVTVFALNFFHMKYAYYGWLNISEVNKSLNLTQVGPR